MAGLVYICILFTVSNTLTLNSMALVSDATFFHVFTNPDCEGCMNAIQPLLNIFPRETIIYDIKDSKNLEVLIGILEQTGMESPILPLILILKNDTLFAVVEFRRVIFSQDDWIVVTETKYDRVPVYFGKDGYGVVKPETFLEDIVCQRIAKLLTDKSVDELATGLDFQMFIPAIVAAALADAINPCEFHVLIIFLTLVIFNMGKKAVLRAGLTYSAAIFTIYFALGSGMNVLLRYSHPLKPIMAMIVGVASIILGLREMVAVTLGKNISRVPTSISDKLSSLLQKNFATSLGSFIVGAVAGILLLPCTSAPYFVALSLISRTETIIQGVILLFIYNIIIIVPFLLITLMTYTFDLKTSQLKRWFKKTERSTGMTLGLIYLALGLLLFSFM